MGSEWQSEDQSIGSHSRKQYNEIELNISYTHCCSHEYILGELLLAKQSQERLELTDKSYHVLKTVLPIQEQHTIWCWHVLKAASLLLKDTFLTSSFISCKEVLRRKCGWDTLCAALWLSVFLCWSKTEWVSECVSESERERERESEQERERESMSKQRSCVCDCSLCVYVRTCLSENSGWWSSPERNLTTVIAVIGRIRIMAGLVSLLQFVPGVYRSTSTAWGAASSSEGLILCFSVSAVVLGTIIGTKKNTNHC